MKFANEFGKTVVGEFSQALPGIEEDDLRVLNTIIVAELKDRRRRESARAIIAMAVGQHVKFVSHRDSHGVYPGDTGEIVAIKQTKVHVRWQRHFGEPIVLVSPASSVEVVEPTAATNGKAPARRRTAAASPARVSARRRVSR